MPISVVYTNFGGELGNENRGGLEAQGKMVDDAFAGIDMTLILKCDDSVVVKDRNHGGSK